MSNVAVNIDLENYKVYPISLTSDKYKHLLLIQSHPECRVIFQDMEIGIDELKKILDNIKPIKS